MRKRKIWHTGQDFQIAQSLEKVVDHLPPFYDPSQPGWYQAYHWNKFIEATSTDPRLTERVWKSLTCLISDYQQLDQETQHNLTGLHAMRSLLPQLTPGDELLALAQQFPHVAPEAKRLIFQIAKWALSINLNCIQILLVARNCLCEWANGRLQPPTPVSVSVIKTPVRFGPEEIKFNLWLKDEGWNFLEEPYGELRDRMHQKLDTYLTSYKQNMEQKAQRLGYIKANPNKPRDYNGKCKSKKAEKIDSLLHYRLFARYLCLGDPWSELEAHLRKDFNISDAGKSLQNALDAVSERLGIPWRLKKEKSKKNVFSSDSISAFP